MDDNQKKSENKGYLFKNKRKNKQAQPDMTGKINWEGKELSIAAWEKTSSSGEKFLSLALSEVFKPADNGEGNQGGNNQGNQGNQGGGYSSQQPAYEKKNPNSTAAHPDNSLNELNDLFE